MNKIEMAIELLQMAREEQKNMDRMNKELLEAKQKWDWEKESEIRRRYSPIPKRSVINDCLKMARRLIHDAYV